MNEKKIVSEYAFTNDWFSDQVKSNFSSVFELIKPTKILEIGSFEGASACYVIDSLAANSESTLEIHCVDTWQGSIEYVDRSFNDTRDINMLAVEDRFHQNTQRALQRALCQVSMVVHKGQSSEMLAKLIADHHKFDFIYIDGSHQASDVLCDAVMAFQLLSVGGIIGFDDYLWFEAAGNDRNILRAPKVAIDAFTNIYAAKLEFLRARSDQVYIRRIA